MQGRDDDGDGIADKIDEAIGRASASATPLLAAPQETLVQQLPSPRGVAHPQGDALMTEAKRLANQQLDALFEEDASNLPMFLRLLSGMSREAEVAERAEAVRLLVAVAADLSESQQQDMKRSKERDRFATASGNEYLGALNGTEELHFEGLREKKR